ncbi:hypothetical protein [uncultured Paenibacillus sp.]|uniref:hypothetical protein n=1 Tax=uncultured Paenibacillus sp. TaxID=227322 RepID=UPI0015B1A494|nr:hypothetical protein [uncultured Paenibacillus sp.]
MKSKIVTGLVVLFLCVGATAVYGEAASLIGARVSGLFSVEVNGKMISDAIVVNGSTYVPVRSLTEAAGFDLSVTGKKVVIKTDEDIKMEGRINELKSNLEGLNSEKQITQTSIDDTNKKIQQLMENPLYDELSVDRKSSDAYKSLSAELAKYQAQLAETQAKIDAANAEIAELQAQIDANK